MPKAPPAAERRNAKRPWKQGIKARTATGALPSRKSAAAPI
jgi:hypothetical protein